jgi:cyclase
MHKRVIPKVTVFDGIAYQTSAYRRGVYLGDPINVCNVLAEQGCQELVLVGPENGTGYDIRTALSVCRSPVTVGGRFEGLDGGGLVAAGAEKVIVSDSLWDGSSRLQELAAHVGQQAVCASVDYRELPGGRRMVVRGAGRDIEVGPLDQLLDRLDQAHIGELLLSDVSRDGSRAGLDLEVVSLARRYVPDLPLLLGGGHDGSLAWEDVAGLDGIVASSAFFLFGARSAALVCYPERYAVA